jgi:hypothetical protein
LQRELHCFFVLNSVYLKGKAFEIKPQKGGKNMDKKIIVALDAMGGDYAPVETVKGAVDAVKELNVDIKLVGPEDVVKAELAKYQYDESRIEVVHAPSVIGTDEAPTMAIRRKNGEGKFKYSGESYKESANELIDIVTRKLYSMIALEQILQLAGFEFVTEDADVDLTIPDRSKLIELFS